MNYSKIGPIFSNSIIKAIYCYSHGATHSYEWITEFGLVSYHNFRTAKVKDYERNAIAAMLEQQTLFKNSQLFAIFSQNQTRGYKQ